VHVFKAKQTTNQYFHPPECNMSNISLHPTSTSLSTLCSASSCLITFSTKTYSGYWYIVRNIMLIILLEYRLMAFFFNILNERTQSHLDSNNNDTQKYKKRWHVWLQLRWRHHAQQKNALNKTVRALNVSRSSSKWFSTHL